MEPLNYQIILIAKRNDLDHWVSDADTIAPAFTDAAKVPQCTANVADASGTAIPRCPR